MHRLERKIHILKEKRRGSFDPDQHYVEAALRSRTARKVRTHIRRLEPLVVMTPRWSRPQGFLEDIALDLAVGEPAVGCRTVSLKPLKGRGTAEAWQFLITVMSQLSEEQWAARMLPMVGDSRGFRNLAVDLLLRAQERRGAPIALLCHGAEVLPIDVLEDLSQAWSRFVERQPTERRTTLVLAASVDAPNIHLEEADRVQLQDFGEAEAAAWIIGRSGPVSRGELETAARFSGGIPAIVDALALDAGRRGAVARTRPGLVRTIGPLADEIRMAVDIVSCDSALADRLDELMRGEPLIEVPSVDRPLMTAGLLRRVRLPGEDRVMLRAPAIGAVIG